MAPTNPSARGRGRPAKDPSDASPALVKTGAVAAASPAGGVKRGRGRPPKDPSGLPQRVLNPKPTAVATGPDGTPIKRGRGRPPKGGASSGSVAKKTKTASTSTPSGRGRGRPPGAGKIAKATALALAGAESAGGTPRSAKTGSRVARGGPTKAARDEEDAEAEDEELELGGLDAQGHGEEELGEDINMYEGFGEEDRDAVADEDEEDGGE